MADGCMRFMFESFVDIDILANFTQSSEQASYPATNAFNKQRRSKVWRSNGYFKIESGSNTIVFRETAAGPDLTATITVGEYTSTTSFMAAVKSALDSAGASTYTVTQSAALKFVIASDGAGGAGDFSILWSNASSTAMAGILGFDTTDDTGLLSYTADLLRINTEEFIQFDMGIASIPNALMLTGFRNTALKLSPSGTFKLEASHSNNFTSAPFSETLTYDHEVISLIRDAGISTTGYRYWRIKFEDQNPNGYVEVGAFFLGEYYTPAQGRSQFPFGFTPIDRSTTVFSEGGQTFHDKQGQTATITTQWKNISKEDKENLEFFFAEFGRITPFFASFDTNAAFSTEFERNVRYVKFDVDPFFELQSPNNYAATMIFREQL